MKAIYFRPFIGGPATYIFCNDRLRAHLAAKFPAGDPCGSKKDVHQRNLTCRYQKIMGLGKCISFQTWRHFGYLCLISGWYIHFFATLRYPRCYQTIIFPPELLGTSTFQHFFLVKHHQAALLAQHTPKLAFHGLKN